MRFEASGTTLHAVHSHVDQEPRGHSPRGHSPASNPRGHFQLADCSHPAAARAAVGGGEDFAWRIGS